MIEFIDDGHIYLVDGVITPSVSEILKFIFPNKYKDVPIKILQSKAEYGTKVHETIETLENKQMFEMENLKSELEGITYTIELSIKEYLKLKKECEINVIEQEQIIQYKNEYAGRFDMTANVNGYLSLCDIKTTSELDKEYLSWQLSFYELAKGKMYEKLYAIWLPKKKLGQVVEIERKPKEELLKVLEEFKNGSI